MALLRHPESGLYVPEASLQHPEAPLQHPEDPLRWPEASGAAPPATSAEDPPTFISSVTVLHYWNTELDLSATGTDVDSWQDQVGAAHRVGTAPRRPVLTASDATLNNKPTVAANGSSQTFTGGPDRPAPGTSNTWFWSVFKPVTYASAGRFVAAMGIQYGATANTMRQALASNGNEVAIVAGTWYRLEALFSNTAADYLKVGSATSTPIGVGNTNPAAITWYANATPASFGAFAEYCMLITNGLPNAGERDALDDWATAHLAGIVGV